MELPIIGKVRRPGLWLAGLVVLAIASAGGAVTLSRSRSSGPDYSDLTVTVSSEAIRERIAASGTVQPTQTVNLSPKVAGILVELLVDQGDTVAAGQPIARMESEEVNAQLRQDRASLAEAEAQLRSIQLGSRREEIARAEAGVAANQAQIEDAQARLNLAEDRLSRNRDLQAQGAISLSDLNDSLNEVQVAEAALRQAQARTEEARQQVADLQNRPDRNSIDEAAARIERIRGQIQATESRLEDTLIRAPFAGVITQKFATEGAFVTPTTTASTATAATSTAIVALADGLEVLAEIPEADISRIEPGMAVEVRADAFLGETFDGEVRLIAPEAIERDGVTLFQIRVALLSGTEQLRSNMNVTLDFLGEQVSGALTVPTVAVITQDGQSGVLVPGDNNRIRFRPVTLGSQVGDRIQILEGVEVGDDVFIDLPPGQSLENLTFGREG